MSFAFRFQYYTKRSEIVHFWQ